jgi:excisionase family DNA binding protein
MARTTSTNGRRTLTVHQVAERLNISARTVWAWIAEGRLRAIKLGPRTTRIAEDAVDELLRNCVEPPSDVHP